MTTMTRLPSGRTLMLGTASAAVLALAVVTGTMIGRDAPLRLDRPEVGEFETASAPKAPAAPAPLAEEARPAPLADEARPALREREETAVAARDAARPPVPSPAPPAATAMPAPPAGDGGAARIAGAPADSAAKIAPQSAPAPVQSEMQSTLQSAPTVAPMAGAGGAIGYGAAPAPDMILPGWREQGHDRFASVEPNGLKVTAEEPVSTFSVDVDTASYAFVRRALMEGTLPPKDAVRIEEMVNYFPYGYAPPESREAPFAAHLAVMATPWSPDTKLLRIGIKGYDLPPAARPRANLVFLVDTSGSMDAPDKLPLLVNSFRLLVESLAPGDRVAIVSYAGQAGTVLEPTPVAEKAKILAALDRLMAGGSTAGGEGIRQAYRLAEAGFDPEGVNRVILATDGDFNVGITSVDELTDFVERERESGIQLSILGFGRGNLNDELMQSLAQNGNGQAAYIDTLAEARKALVDEVASTLFPIAQDVKVQVEFNPAAVAEYRLIGYETRLLAREDFSNDRVDAGEIGAGHSVTALYEIVPAGSSARRVEPLRYRRTDGAPAADTATGAHADEYAFVRIRYKLPGEGESRLIERPVTPADEGDADADARFAAAVAAFGQLLRGETNLGAFGYDDVVRLANGARGEDPYGYRAEFVTLARLAASAAGLEPHRR